MAAADDDFEIVVQYDEEALAQFGDVFKRFALPSKQSEQEASEVKPEKTEDDGADTEKPTAEEGDAKKADSDEEQEVQAPKKKKKRVRIDIAELKQVAARPEIVEWVDITAADPKFLVYLKSYRNTVPVPRHWSQKRKYLQGKRGIEKKAFELPEFIKATGIAEMRTALKEKEGERTLKSKARERLNPKMNRVDIDYQKLHDAFFRFQTKPKMTRFGDLYYEGKEFEAKVKEWKPGHLSEELKKALNMPPLAPPPWLINMQRRGPPPSYPNLKIPGLNAPIPEGAQWGFHPGGWGRPPVDEFNRPLYGDVFGTAASEVPKEVSQPVQKKLWGMVEEEEIEEEEEEEAAEEAGQGDESELEGLQTPSGISSVPSGVETPDVIELRKDTRRPEDYEQKQLYTILPQRETKLTGFVGTQHVYDLSAATKPGKRKFDAVGTGEVEVALDPAEMEDLTDETIKAKYDERMQTEAEQRRGEDFSDMVAERARQDAKKRKKVADAKTKEKEKSFKF